jgi:hypothetical protein
MVEIDEQDITRFRLNQYYSNFESLIEKECSKQALDLKITAAAKLDKSEWWQKKKSME